MNNWANTHSVKIFLIIIFGFIVWSCEAGSEEEIKSSTDISQKDSTSLAEHDTLHFSDTIENIKSIKEEYGKIVQIRQNGLLDSTSVRYDCAGEKTGIINYFTYKDTLLLIERDYNEYSHTDGTDQYYIVNDRPYFSFHKTTNWHFDSDTEKPDDYIESIQEDRYYILGDSLHTCLNKQYETHSGSDKNPDPDQIANLTVQCPIIQPLINEFEKLISHQKDSTDISCL